MTALAARPAPDRYAFAQSPCGGIAMALAGAEVLMRSSGALLEVAHNALIVADLHFEKGSAYGMRGQFLPPYDTRDTLDRLEAEVRALSPRMVIFLGDSFHDRHAEDRLAPDDAARLAALAQGRTLIWLVGNHDADGPRRLPGEVADTLRLGPLVLRHEPEPGVQMGELSGHLHPCARVSSGRGTVRRRCFATDGDRMILPAFGAYAGGLNLRDGAFAGLFSRTPLAGALGRDKVHAVGWRSLTPD